MKKPVLLALNHIDGLKTAQIRRLEQHFDSVSALIHSDSRMLSQFGLSAKACQAIVQFDERLIDEDLQWSEQRDQRILTWHDAKYPSLLKQIPAPPPILYAKGDINHLKRYAIAIVGSRKATPYGLEIAFEYSHHLAKMGINIVSGLARGIDGMAHQACIDAKGHTTAIMGTGFSYIYPRSNRQLAQSIAQKGLIMTEFPLYKPPLAYHFPRRNRIISGLVGAVLVVEASLSSGSLISARLALDYGRDVWAIPGSIFNFNSKGCHSLIQQGAKLITSLEDIIEEIPSLPFLQQPQEKTNSLLKGLALDAQNLVKFVGYETTSVETIIHKSQMGPEKVAALLIELETLGIIKAVPGGYMRGAS